jgi:hypothetical protein
MLPGRLADHDKPERASIRDKVKDDQEAAAEAGALP